MDQTFTATHRYGNSSFCGETHTNLVESSGPSLTTFAAKRLTTRSGSQMWLGPGLPQRVKDFVGVSFGCPASPARPRCHSGRHCRRHSVNIGHRGCIEKCCEDSILPGSSPPCLKRAHRLIVSANRIIFGDKLKDSAPTITYRELVLHLGKSMIGK